MLTKTTYSVVFFVSRWWNPRTIKLELFNIPLLFVWFWGLKNQIHLRAGTEAPREWTSLFLILVCTLRLWNRKEKYILASSSASHRHEEVISRFITAAATGPTNIRLGIFYWVDSDCRTRPDECIDLGPRSGWWLPCLDPHSTPRRSWRSCQGTTQFVLSEINVWLPVHDTHCSILEELVS